MSGIRVAAIVLLLVAPAAAAPRTLKLRFPRMTVLPQGNIEACYFVRVPLREPFDVGRYAVRNRGARAGFAVRHFLVYLYQGEQLAAFASEGGRIVPSRGCQDLGPTDRDRRQLIVSSFGVRSRGTVPAGLALPLTPVPDLPGGAPAGIGILLDTEWLNADARPHAGSTLVTLYRAPRGSVKRRLIPILARTAERGLAVPPDTLDSTENSTLALGGPSDGWGPGVVTDDVPAPTGPACVVSITAHMRKRGVLFAVDRLRADGSLDNPPDGPRNPFDGRTHLYAVRDYTDPGVLGFSPPLLLTAGERLRYACWHDNGKSIAPRQGCEELPATSPGRAAGRPEGGPAKPCRIAGEGSPDCPSTDPEFPGRSFTGACVEANLVAGPTPDDEVCALAGFYYDATPDGGCDVSALPPLP